jgi:peptidoglycan L-alanyl-D-glutamate endopeptidase CwlK
MESMSESRRERIRKDLHKLYLPIYDSLCAQLKDHWQPTDGYRSIKDQDAVYEQGRTTPGPIVTKARGGYSPHNYGCATDWCLWEDGKPIWDEKDPRWFEYEIACAKAGAVYGGSFKVPDHPHNQMPIVGPWRSVGIIYRDKGIDEALKYIEQNAI